MRGALYLLAAALVVASAFLSYRMSYAMQDRVDVAERLQRAIDREREAIAVLRAEWAYLNAPERLEGLARRHAAELALAPMTPGHFAPLDHIDPPAPDDGMEPVLIIDLDDVAPPVVQAPSPSIRPARVSAR